VTLFVGTAGWTIPRAVAERFPGDGSHLERYARVFDGAEIDSTFRHDHRDSTFRRWAASTGPAFRFAVKLPELITHDLRLEQAEGPLEAFLDQIGALGGRLGPLLVQLPASLVFSPRVASGFFATLRKRFDGAVVCEPREAGWFGAEADRLLQGFQVGRVAADPARVPEAAHPGGWTGDRDRRGLVYYRWHGSPVVYRSSYASGRLAQWAAEVRTWQARADCWCIFDNTASGAAARDALEFLALAGAPESL
jgi:uncharacterized protein YecE (DUF72 family)